MQKNVSTPRHAAAKKTPLRQRLARAMMITGVAFLLLIPSYIAIFHYERIKNSPDHAADTDYVLATLGTGADAKTAALAEDGTAPDLLRLLRALVASVDASAEQPARAADYTVSLQNRLGTDVFSLWFDLSAPACVVAGNGACRYAGTAETAEFLNSPFAAALYPQSTPPVLTTAATDVVVPASLSWYYKMQNNEFGELADVAVTDEVLIYPIANDIDFSFSIQPSSYTVTITHEGVAATFEGGETISLSHLARGDLLNVEIAARYERSSANAYYGEATYRFTLRVAEAAQFEMTVTSVREGSYYLLECKNIKNVQNLEISDVGVTPVLFARGELLYAAIPAGAAGTHTLHVRYGTVAGTFTLTTLPNAGTEHAFEAADLRGDVAALPQALAALIAAHAADSAIGETALFTPASLPSQSGTQALAFGDTVVLSGETAGTPLTFEYYTDVTAVTAASPALVAYVGYGDEALGNYVILDHGCGLYSWYGGMDQVRVSAGDPIAAGDTLGTAGTGGFGIGDDAGLLFLVTLGTTPIDPAVLRAGGTFLSPIG